MILKRSFPIEYEHKKLQTDILKETIKCLMELDTFAKIDMTTYRCQSSI